MDEYVRDFWNRRSVLGQAAGSNDVIAKKLEIEALATYVKDGDRILDFGCGNGVTALELARRHRVDVYGIDYAEEMITAAREAAEQSNLLGSVRFSVGDLTSLESLSERFDLIYTERVLINLKDWTEQSNAIVLLTNLLSPGGIYAMCENSEEGLQYVNALRHDVGLAAISPPWHNRYIRDDQVLGLNVPGSTLENVNYYSSTYYFLSRVINAALAENNGASPEYNSPINQLALTLPPLCGNLGQGRIWVWRKKCADPE